MRSILFFIIIAALQLGYSQSEPEPLLIARAQMSIGNYEQAIEKLNRVIADSPNNIDAIYQRGISYYKTKQYREAVSDFLLVNKRNSARASLMLAKCEARLNHPELVSKYLREHLGSSYKKPEKEILLDEDLQLIDNTAEWQKLWKEKEWYNVFDRQLQEALYNKSIENYPDALNMLNELNDKGYDRSVVNMHLADIYKNTGNINASLNALNASISKDYRNTEALKMRIDYNIESAVFDQAAKDCQRLLRLAPDEFTYYLTYARVLSEIGDFEKAKKNIETYLDLFPGSDEAYNELGYISLKGKKYLDAISYLNKAIAKENGNAAYYYNRGRAYSATGMYKYAINDYSMALDLEPDDPNIWFEKGKSDLKQGNVENACHGFKKALQYGNTEALDYIQRICN